MTVPVKYIDVNARSDMFVAATRAFGTIAIVGRGRTGSPVSEPRAFTDPADAVKEYSLPGRTVDDGVLNSTTTLTSAKAAFVAADVGRTVSGRGVADKTEIVSITDGTTVVLSKAATATANEVSITLGRTPPSDLEAAIAIAFRQSPPPTTIWGVQVDAATPGWDDALTAVSTLDAQIVLLANTPLNDANKDTLRKLAAHVNTVSNTGSDGKERIGVAMLDTKLSAVAAAALNTGPLSDERMVLIAHKSDEDAAAALAGVVAGYEPHISLLLKPIRLNQTTAFTDTEIDAFDQGFVNWVTSPVLLPGRGTYLGEAYTANPSQGNKKYVDVVRTLDDTNFRIKAGLIRSIGNLRISRSGLRAVETIVESVLSPLVSQHVIEDYGITIPLLVLLEKDPASLSAAELAQIQAAQANRNVDMTVTVDYAGAIHRLHIDLVFT
ncbi:hypothetical protein ASF98_21385 [Arthrobacter sp. Leaf337]|nr:hypothetical protein ASF98_21385 [Arthrobacter sp. Leaf337]